MNNYLLVKNLFFYAVLCLKSYSMLMEYVLINLVDRKIKQIEESQLFLKQKSINELRKN